ncbi:TRAP transporter small permease [Falsochrobactrum ovis]|uniref:TRAP transporter small permease protein n=1 Tax=Falsochrobactrum ovis TaxID=1293442 RepID=A0A364JRY9_9HYPH|nr:TRAP transporter small permease [Falsochrobactrum ovis]RAK24778.1 TRAP-type C4-dicarboxylate transport system permease small subunit [Falsochrobactrum ovis]
MKKAIDLFYSFIGAIMVFCLAAMAVMVFVNVVLRYTANSGLNVSDELSRYFFIWVSFIGAVLTFRDNNHLGIETLVAKFSRNGRIICMILVNLIIMLCAAVFFWGTWKQSGINASMHAPVTGLPMIYVYGVGMFTGGGIFIISMERLWRLLTGRVTDDEIARFAGENLSIEEMAER